MISTEDLNVTPQFHCNNAICMSAYMYVCMHTHAYIHTVHTYISMYMNSTYV